MKVPDLVTANVPKVSVVMGVFNGADKLLPTVESILNQTFEDFEFIIVDDGSTDPTAELLQNCAERDPRIVVLRQTNGGLTQALIRGTGHARGELIARQDAGDRSLPRRLEKQVAYLDRHQQVVAVGAGSRRIGPHGEWLGDRTRDLTPMQVTDELLANGAGLSHTVAMFRRSAFESVGGYRGEFRFAQDTDLWHRLIDQGLLAELPEVLFEWGIDVDGISSSSHDRQRRLAELARQSYDCRQRGEDDADVLEQARRMSWEPITQSDRIPKAHTVATAEFFIGSQLFSLGDARCRGYFLRALRRRPCWLRPWAKILLSFVKQPQRHA